ASLGRNQGGDGPWADQGGYVCADRKTSCQGVTPGSQPLQALFRGFHGEERQHQHKLDIEDQVSVLLRPTLHFGFDEPLQLQYVPSNPKQEYPHQDQKGQDLKAADQHIVNGAQKGKQPVGAQDSVQNDLQYLDIDDDEAQIDEDVQQSRHGTDHHLGLAQGNARHIPPPLGFVVTDIHVPPQFDVPQDLFDISGKESNAKDQGQYKEYVGQVFHLGVLLVLWFIPAFPLFRGIVLGQGIFLLFLSEYRYVDVAFWVQPEILQQQVQFLGGIGKVVVQGVVLVQFAQGALSLFYFGQDPVQAFHGGLEVGQGTAQVGLQ